MQFTNPASLSGPVSVDPLSTIAVVSQSVPFPNRDTFFWPAISGESFPPSKNGASAYAFSAENGTPIITAAQSGGSQGQVTYPNLPRVGYNGKQRMVWDWYGWVQGQTFPITANTDMQSAIIGYNLTNWRTGYVYKSNAGGTALDLYIRHGATALDILVAAGEPNLRLRHFQIFLDANSDAEWWIDGVQIYVHAGWWPPLYNGQAVPTMQLTATSNAAGIIAATRLTAQWT